MKSIIKKSKNIILRKTNLEDLEFVIRAERDKENLCMWDNGQNNSI
ncbi:hypothetical protein H477_2302 [[Clostridium] sordellii ATCC 9714]|nr:hypothetical protein H477_2302 [[Clostridium] sordellii ATCC 9714] [Paeniclostridium sordellii ATCC 9714]